MMIHADKCLELGLPIPKAFNTQSSYIMICLKLGLSLNTRECRYIGIHNLHSMLSILKKKGVLFTLTHCRVKCPFTGDTPPHPVDVAYMTIEQRQENEDKNKPA